MSVKREVIEELLKLARELRSSGLSVSVDGPQRGRTLFNNASTTL